MLSQLPTYKYEQKGGDCSGGAAALEAEGSKGGEEGAVGKCSICMERYEGNEEIKILPCMH